MMHRLYHFLGSITFALILIATTACCAIAGTFFESATDSHQYAAQLTYGSSFFSLLLWGFFLNILISALRRYPFKKRHLPFLITHLGMLMVLGGVLIKNYFGTQGVMTVLEGSASDQIFLKDKPALLIESKNGQLTQFYTFSPNFSRYSLLTPDNMQVEEPKEPLTITLLDYAPNSYETIETWIKGSYTSIFGIRPVPAHLAISSTEELPLPIQVMLPQSHENPWNLLALISDSPEALAKKIYTASITVTVREISSKEQIYHGPLTTLLKENITTPYGKLKTRLDFTWSLLKGCEQPTLFIELAGQEKEDKVAISLGGDDALLNRNDFPFIGKGRMTIDLSATSTLLLLKDLQNDVHLFVFTKYGQIVSSSYLQGSLDTILAYDDGHLGYSLEIKLPHVEKTLNRQMRELQLMSAMQNDRDNKISPEILLSGYLRNYATDSDVSLASKDKLSEHDLPLILESPLSTKHRAIPPSNKLEQNIPCIVLRFKKGSQEEVISLRYDPTGSSFKWPVLNGEFIVRFQPLLKEIPYRLRLRQARQINYATSNQTFSYESDLIITEIPSNQSVESQISMNNVHETWDGYRFYLSDIYPPDKGALKRIQIVVNRDPAKYLMTYPGACLMVLGILLLFFRKRKT